MNSWVYELVASADGSPQVHQAWTELSGQVTSCNSFYRPEMLRPALENYASGDVYLFLVWADTNKRRLLALWPVTLERAYRRLPVTRISPWRYKHCYCNRPLVRQGYERPFFDHLQACNEVPGVNGAIVLSLDWYPSDAHSWPIMISSIFAGHKLFRAHMNRNRACLTPAMDLAGSISTKRRKELRRLRRRLAEIGDLGFREIKNAELSPGLIDDFLHLENTGWKKDAGTSLHSDAANRAFAKQALNGLAERGVLRIYELRLDGRLIASLLTFAEVRELFLFKIAYSEEFAAYSPGVQLIIEASNHWQRDGEFEIIDSCADQEHPMINPLWCEKRLVTDVEIALTGQWSKLAVLVPKLIAALKGY